MKLYTYWRSTSSYRVRIALALKEIEAEQVFVHLVRNGGEQNAPDYRAINPQGRVPALELDDGTFSSSLPRSWSISRRSIRHPRSFQSIRRRGPRSGRWRRSSAVTSTRCTMSVRSTISGRLSAVPSRRSRTGLPHGSGRGFLRLRPSLAMRGSVSARSPRSRTCTSFRSSTRHDGLRVPLDAYPRILRVEKLAAEHEPSAGLIRQFSQMRSKLLGLVPTRVVAPPFVRWLRLNLGRGLLQPARA